VNPAIVEAAKRLLCTENECSWQQFVDGQEMGDCQGIAHEVARNLPQFRRVVGEIDVDPYIDEDGMEQTCMVHHWVTLDGLIYDFAKGTLRHHMDITDPYDPFVEDPSIYHAGMSK
jgi:hypothetical protein